MANATYDKKYSAIYKRARNVRIHAMFKRFRKAWPAARQTDNVASMIMTMRGVMRGDLHRLPGFEPANAIEAADLVVDQDYEPPGECEPCVVSQGTRAKLDVLAARLAAGESLHHKKDGVVL